MPCVQSSAPLAPVMLPSSADSPAPSVEAAVSGALSAPAACCAVPMHLPFVGLVEPMMKSAFSSSVAAPFPPLAKTTTRSKRLRSGGGNPELTTKEAPGSYEAPRPCAEPPLQFWAATTLHRERSRHTSPALATETVCCSIASCTAALSWLRIVENSSMQHTPPSASTSAPASRTKSGPSRMAAHVKPALVQPSPLVRTLRTISS
mmetsp:Transcript_70435/g.178529  ORF Transcript_70435/g.178529 Transcript_70435/m.178529 type:complete len:205 (-) Transcript_70435:22-636(-)